MMNRDHTELFLMEIQMQCIFADRAWENLEEGILKGDYDLQWYSIEALLVATANISKYLWATEKSSEEKKARCKDLRDILELGENNPLESRKMRDAFEHSDTRLGLWIGSQKGGNHLGRISTVSGVRESPRDYGRYFERDTRRLVFFGEECSLATMANEVKTLARRCSKATIKLRDVPAVNWSEKVREFQKARKGNRPQNAHDLPTVDK
jgi:hypothetical protein